VRWHETDKRNFADPLALMPRPHRKTEHVGSEVSTAIAAKSGRRGDWGVTQTIESKGWEAEELTEALFKIESQ